MGVPLAIGDDELNQPNRAGGIAVRLFLYLLVVWAALLLAQSLGGGLPDILANLTAALEHPFAIRWTERSLISIPAGMAGMKMAVFLPFTVLGSFLWNVVLVNLGVIAGGAWEQVVEKTGIFGQIVTWGLVIGVFIGTWALMKRMKRKIT